MDKNKEIKLSEKERVYIFPNNQKVVLKGVTELIVRESGTHRLKTSDGNIHIVPTGWIHIQINETEWTV
jgi:oxalate decarboxylase/phosphoglucose isomerase-like protein (cupin superfamily)